MASLWECNTEPVMIHNKLPTLVDAEKSLGTEQPDIGCGDVISWSINNAGCAVGVNEVPSYGTETRSLAIAGESLDDSVTSCDRNDPCVPPNKVLNLATQVHGGTGINEQPRSISWRCHVCSGIMKGRPLVPGGKGGVEGTLGVGPKHVPKEDVRRPWVGHHGTEGGGTVVNQLERGRRRN